MKTFPRRFLAVAVLAALLGPAVAFGELRLPPVPEDRNFVQDYSGLLSQEAKGRIGQFQKEAFETHDTPIVVVTISSMADYGGEGYTIEHFAYEWFNAWEIGKRGPSGELINKGILLLVSDGDRKARIELGAEWGRTWDGYCARVMTNRIVPEFKRGDYVAGILAGVEALTEMARTGPQGSPSLDLGEALGSKPLSTTPLPLWAVGGMILLGVGSIVVSFFVPEHRKAFRIAGAALIAGAIFFWVLLVVFAWVTRGSGTSSSRGSSSSGGYSGGGFSSGGFSGGGGATGSW